MSHLIPIDEVAHFDVCTHVASTGAVSDADSAPTFSVYEEDTDTAILGPTSMTKRTSLTGNYRGNFTASAANGFEAGKWYSVIVSATVSTIAAKTVAMHFRAAPAESSAGVPKGDVSHFGGTAGTFSGGRPEVNTTHAAGTAWGSGAITAASIASDAITAAKVADGAIDAATFAAGAINAAAIAADAITDAKVASDVTIASVTGAVGSVTGNVGGNVTGSVGSIATGGISAASFAAGAVDAAALAADAGTEIGTAVWASAARTLTALDEDSTTLDLDATLRAAVGMSSANLDTQLSAIDDYLDTEVAAIKATTDKLDGMVEQTTDGYIFKTTAVAQVWDETLAAHLTSGSTGQALNAAGAAGDPWTTALPGAYSAGQAGYIIGTNLDATVSSRASQSSVDTIDGIVDSILLDTAEIGAAGAGLTALASAANLAVVAGYLDTEIAAIKAKTDNLPASPAATGDIPSAASVADAVWDEAVSGHTSSGTFGKALDDADDRGSRTVIRGTVTTGASTTSIPTSAFSPAGAAADQFKGRIVIFDNDTATAALRGQATDITASSNSSTPTLTVTALTTTPASGDTFSVV